jgi:UDP-3-O-[3-hydroxymyristoyl] glucosamine N-acyltransferase
VRKPTVYTLAELAVLLDVQMQGDPALVIDGLSSLKSAVPGKLSFLSNRSYANQLADCRASAVIIAPELSADCKIAQLLSSSPYVTYAKASQLFAPVSNTVPGIHAAACVHPSATIGQRVTIDCHAVVEAGAIIGSDCHISAGVFIGQNAVLGAGCKIYPNATIYHDVRIGNNAVIHASAVIGADGFGFAFDGKRSIKIAQLGSVNIGDDVEIGAGALDDTVIEQGVKIDNQVQIAHNCVIGEHTIICGCSAIAGSTTIGRYCTIGGAVGIIGHLRIADKVMISAMSLVSQSISEPGIYSSGTGLLESNEWKRNIVRFRQLDDMAKRLRELEKITLG